MFPRSPVLGGALWATIYVNVAAATLPAVLPVMVGVLADRLGFGAVHAGYVASANLAGIAAGSVLSALAVRRRSWASLIRAGAALMIGANIVTMLLAALPAFVAARAVAGLGEGMISAICYAAMSRTAKSARAMALYVAGQGLAGAVGMASIPGVVAHAGWPWLFAVVSVVALPAFWLAPRIGTLRGAAAVSTTGGGRVALVPVIALLCILVYYVGMSAVWSFSERLGHAKALDLGHLSLALSASAVANMAGSLLIGVFAPRIRVSVGLLLGAALALAGLGWLAASQDWPGFLVAICLFFLSWGVYYPFQFKLLADADRDGGCAILIPLVSGGGFTIGPALGGLVLQDGGPAILCGLGAACVALSTFVALVLRQRTFRGVLSCTG